jgi:hypothetical protein
MLEALATVGVALMSANVGVLWWVGATLWNINGRLVRIETVLKLNPSEGV